MLVLSGTFVLTDKHIYFFMTDEERAEAEAIGKESGESSGGLSVIDGLISSYGVGGASRLDQERRMKGKKDRKWSLADIRDIQRRRYMQQVGGEREKGGGREG